MRHLFSADQSPQSTELLLNCIDFISDTVLVTEALPLDAPGPRVVMVNPAFERMTGYRASDILGRSPRLLQGPKTDRAELHRIRTAIAHWHPVRAELVNYRKNGEEFIVEMDIVPIRGANGQWTHWVSIQRDVTARKKAEAEARLRDVQRFESLGTLSAGIAHDFNNIIAAILGNVAIGTLDMQSGMMPRSSLEQIKTATLRARSVVAKILAYSQQRSDATVPLQLAPVVREATGLLRAILPAAVGLQVRSPAEPLWVQGDAGQLCQVLLNLGVNALQALEGRGGTIQFVLEAASGPPTPAGAAGRRAASIQVIDNGCGMTAATQSRIFEPYFTTRDNGRGTGLGLSVVWGIVTAHGGSLGVESQVGQGSRMTLSLPLIDDESVALPAPPPPPATGAFGNGEHVLVVDDDEVVVVMLEGMLMRWGFRVTSLQDPLQAVTLVKGAPDEFDAVVTDLNMPNVSGLELAREVLAIRRDLPVLLGSGTVSAGLVAAATQAGIAAVFPKEFAVEQLGTLLQASLARPAQPAEPRSDPRRAPLPHGEVRMQGFLTNNRDELVARCKSKVAQRAHRGATESQLASGVPLLIDQLIRTLSAEDSNLPSDGLLISGPAGGDSGTVSEIGVGATAHGKQLLELGYSVDQVVHDYGDLCQAITDLAIERDAPFSVDAYRTLNRCLDNAIANAVTEFALQRDAVLGAAQAAEESRRLGFLAHELRNYLHVALLAFNALEAGGLSLSGSTGAVLKRNLHRLEELIGQTLAEARDAATAGLSPQVFPVAAFIADAASIADLCVAQTGCTLCVPAVDPQLAIRGSRELLLAALGNLLQNAFKFTRPNTEVTLEARAVGGRILIEVRDHCGGLPAGAADMVFTPFTQARKDDRGVGLGLSIAAQSVAADGGRLSVRDVPGAGCVFTIDLPAESTDGNG